MEATRIGLKSHGTCEIHWVNRTGSVRIILMGTHPIAPALWLEVRRAYIAKEGSCAELAKRFGLNPVAVSSRCRRHKWRIERGDLQGEIASEIDQVKREVMANVTKKAAKTFEEQARSFMQRAICETDEWLDTVSQSKGHLDPGDISRLERLNQTWSRTLDQGRRLFGFDRQDVKPQTIVNIALLRGDLKSAPTRENAQPVTDVISMGSGEAESESAHCDSLAEVPVPDCHNDDGNDTQEENPTLELASS